MWDFANDSMAPAFPAGSHALYERHKDDLVAGGYCIFVRRGRKGLRVVRRYLRTTLTGRLVVELFKGRDGKRHRAFLEPDQWRAYYSIVRHWQRHVAGIRPHRARGGADMACPSARP